MGRRIFIGDIQGCREELEELLEVAGFDPAQDELHPVGDLVNRGPDSLGCLRLLASLPTGGVLGNHDLHLIEIAGGRRTVGPKDTLDELLGAPDRDALVGWLAERPRVRVFDDILSVHAGTHPAWTTVERIPRVLLEPTGTRGPAADPGAEAEARFAISARLCDAEGKLPPKGSRKETDRFQPWHAWLEPGALGGRTIVFGHWAAQGFLQRPGLLGLDSGCVWGKQLTAWIPEEERVLRVSARRAYAKIR